MVISLMQSKQASIVKYKFMANLHKRPQNVMAKDNYLVEFTHVGLLANFSMLVVR